MSNGKVTVNDTFKKKWKQRVLVYFEVLSRYLSGRTEVNHKTSVKIAIYVFQSRTSEKWNRGAQHVTEKTDVNLFNECFDRIDHNVE